MQTFVIDNYDMDMEEQRGKYDRMIDAVNMLQGNNNISHRPNVFFLDACAGCGKSWFINLILAGVRAQGCIALATASSGIAAL